MEAQRPVGWSVGYLRETDVTDCSNLERAPPSTHGTTATVCIYVLPSLSLSLFVQYHREQLE
jgi:hypothetical protein